MITILVSLDFEAAPQESMQYRRSEFIGYSPLVKKLQGLCSKHLNFVARTILNQKISLCHQHKEWC